MAFAGGAYSAIDRGVLAVALLWALALGTSLVVWPLEPVPAGALVTGGLFLGLVVVTGVSAFRADSAERAVEELNRSALYFGVLVLGVVAARRADLRAWLAGLASALAVVGLVALVSRLFPDLFPQTAELAQIFPSAEKRLSYPVNYWNGLATLVAFSFPLLLFFATSGRNALLRGLAVLPLPALAGTVYLTSSRGGSVSAALAVLAYFVLAGRRWAAAAATLWATGGAAVVVAVLAARPELVDRPLGSELAEAQGRSAALLILLVCLAVGSLWALACRFAPEPPRVSQAVQAGIAIGLIALLAVGIAAADPRERFERFKEVPPALAGATVQEHLFSGSGNGRWQLWGVAVDEFEREPLLGQGPGSYEAAWAQDGPLDLFVRDAHSLYLETLAELGIVGFALLLGALVAGCVVSLRRVLLRRDDDRSAAAALFAVVAAYAFEAGFDWMWELTVVSALAFLALGLLVGPASLPGGAQTRVPKTPLVRAAAFAALLALLFVQTVSLLSELKIGDSRAAAAAGDATGAVEDAQAARSLEPWASSPRLQLALAQELGGDVEGARVSISEALERDPTDWRLWLVSARISTKAGEFDAARRSLNRAAELNPRSSLFEASQ